MNMTRTLTLSCSLACLLAAAASGSAEPAPKPVDLVAGGTFVQWMAAKGGDAGAGWKIKDGVIHRSGKSPGDIVTRAVYDDFELTFEWKISEGGNSGVKYRVQDGLGLEFQVLDDAGHADGEKPSHRAASLYDLVAAPDDKPIHPPGSWNASRIVANGPLLEHWLNGKKVVTIDQSTADWEGRFQKSKYRTRDGFGVGAGRILLQDHGDEVWYRNLRIRALNDESE